MEQLTTLDASFLQAEDSDRHVSLAIGGLAVIEGSAPDYATVKHLLAERIHAIPRCTKVLRTRPFDLAAPEWVDDPGFRLCRHVKRVALPRPGGDAELFGVIADILERRLDRDRPLWECWMIEGLQGNRWAILMKIHHCVADGISATHILTGLCDAAGTGTPAARARARTQPADTAGPAPAQRPAFPGVNPLAWADNLWQAAATVTDSAARTVAGAARIATGLLWPATGSSLNGPITGMRRYCAVRVRMDTVADVSRRFGVSVNDVALAAITEGFRDVLTHRGEQPHADALRALVPVSVRTAEAMRTPDNRISIMLPRLPVDLDDPLQRLRTVHTRLTTAKRSGQRQAGSTLASATNVIPFAVSSWAIRLLTRLPQRGVVTLATNVPGPRRRLQIMGRDVVSLLPVPPIALRLRTGIAVLSYADELVFGITADYDATGDISRLARGIERSIARLDALSKDSIALFSDERRRRAARARPGGTRRTAARSVPGRTVRAQTHVLP